MLPTIWYRNTWSWGSDIRRPRFQRQGVDRRREVIETIHDYYGSAAAVRQAPPLLFTENETNSNASMVTMKPRPM